MTLPAYSLEWEDVRTVSSSQLANAQLSNRQALRLWRNDMLTAGWLTRDYECNGTTAGTKGDGVARINSNSDMVGAAPGANHAWWIDTPIGGMGQICVDLDSTSDGAFSVHWSPAAGFTGGTVSARPTATDQQEITQGINGLATLNGSYEIHSMACETSGREAIRVIFLNSATSAGPVAIFSLEHAGYTPILWTDPVIARWMGGAGSFGNRSDWTASGWIAYVNGTARTLLAEGSAPQTATDPDGDRLLEPVGLNHAATLGDIGFVRDWWFVDDAVNALIRYENTGGLDVRQVFDEVVFPWPNGPDKGGGLSTAVKLRTLWEPAPDAPDETPPVITMLTDPSIQPDDDLVFEVTDIDPGIQVLYVGITRLSLGVNPGREWVYDAGFLSPWRGTIDVITDGYRVRVKRPSSGWSGRIRLHIRVVDDAGNLE